MKRWLLVLAACGATPSPSPAPAAHTQSVVERGLDLERGRGVARDYRKAVALYREACQNGCGDLAACQRLYRLGAIDRGVVMDGHESATLLATSCDRNDADACLASVMLGLREKRTLPAHRAGEACDRPEVYGCLSISADDPSADTRRAAICKDGDADACDAIGHPLPNAMLCDAGDFGACAKLAKTGDEHARQIACAAGLDAGCPTPVPPRTSSADYAGKIPPRSCP